jgi:glutamine synthetase
MTDTAPTADDVRRIIRETGIDYLFAQFVDMHGKPSAKLVPAAHLDDLLSGGAGFAGFAAGDIGQGPNDPDIVAIPDPASLTVLPFEPTVARLACDVTVEGEAWPFCPRTILRSVLDRAATQGYELRIGAEPEYFLLRRAADGSLAIADELDTLAQPCYDMRALTRNLDFVTEVARAVNGLGWDNYATDHEDANGQFEQNFQFADALTTADRVIFFRYLVESLAQRRGLIATFMPKPFAHLTGNGCHFHISLWRDGVNLFAADPADDPRGLGLSTIAYRFLAGLKAHAKATIALTAPTVNSYKRLSVGTPDSGATWAPAYISYGSNNRTQMLRIPGPGRIEDRTVDGACNPYLASAAMLIAGLDGIERELDPGDPNERNLYTLSDADRAAAGIDVLPGNLLDATRELERDEVLRTGLGQAGGRPYVDYFVEVKRGEVQAAHEQITAWELERYLQLF